MACILDDNLVKYLRSINLFLIDYDYSRKDEITIYNDWIRVTGTNVSNPEYANYLLRQIKYISKVPKNLIKCAARIDHLI